MTRKDYVAIAKSIAQTRTYIDQTSQSGERRDAAFAGIDLAVAGIAGVLATDNPRFDRDRFLKACGL